MGIVDDDDASETINDIVTLQKRKLRIDRYLSRDR